MINKQFSLDNQTGGNMCSKPWSLDFSVTKRDMEFNESIEKLTKNESVIEF